jgi:Dimerisation domain
MNIASESSSDASPGLVLRRLISSYRITQAIHVAAWLGLADHFDDGPKNAAELAGMLDVHPPALGRLLRALVSIGVLADEADGRFALTPIGACLRASSPATMRSWVLCEGAGYYQRAWSDLLHAVQTGEAAFQRTQGLPFYQYLSQDGESGEGFARAMFDFGRLMRTDWSKRSDPESFLNVAQDGPHSPGIDGSAADLLAYGRDVLGIGVETIGTDAGQAGSFKLPFPATPSCTAPASSAWRACAISISCRRPAR